MQEIKSVTYVRALAQLMIIGAHIQFVVPWMDRLDLIRTVRPFFENATFPFFILSGLLLALVNNQTSYRDFLRKKLKSVVIPYLIAILPVVFIYAFFSEFLPVANRIYLMRETTTWVALTSGKNSINIAMWFFPVICTFFLISPLFKWLSLRPRYLMLFVLTTFFLSLLTHRPPSTAEFLRSFQYFLFPFGLGVLMGVHFQKSQYLLKKGVWIFLVLFILVYLLQVKFGPLGGLDRLGSWDEMSFSKPDLSLLQKLFLSLFLLGLFNRYEAPRWMDQWLQTISHYAFGLHLYHGYFLTLYIFVLGKWQPGYGIGMFLLQYIFVVLVCLALCKTVVKLSPRAAQLLFSFK